jgi:2-alkyl-3-oxoalkanoate reductase
MLCLVTGATGFVGYALCERLLREGHRVRALVRAPSTALTALGVETHVGNLGDPNSIARAAAGCEVLFHCASETSHRASKAALSWINVAGTENVLKAAKHAGARRVVHLSCADVTITGEDRLSAREDQAMAREPLDACAKSKLLAEELALQSSNATLEVTALRPPWVWGPGDHTTLPQLCREGLRGGVRLFGDGSNLLATVYIDNLTHALVLAATAANAPGNSYHVVDGEFMTVREFLSLLSQHVGLAAPRRGIRSIAFAWAWVNELRHANGPWRTDVARRACGSLLDAQRAPRDLNYASQVSVADGMQALSRWVQSQGGPAAIAKLTRPIADDSVVSAHERMASST